jgi:hypothetical protein
MTVRIANHYKSRKSANLLTQFWNKRKNRYEVFIVKTLFKVRLSWYVYNLFIIQYCFIKKTFQQDVQLVGCPRNSPVNTEFPRQHGNPPSTQNSPVNTEFPRRHRIPSTWNSVDTEFCIFFYFHIFSMLCYAIYFRVRNSVEFCRIPRNFTDFKSQFLQYVWIWVF